MRMIRICAQVDPRDPSQVDAAFGPAPVLLSSDSTCSTHRPRRVRGASRGRPARCPWTGARPTPAAITPAARGRLLRVPRGGVPEE